MSTQNKPPFFAEVIEACLDHYTAQCWDWKTFPTFGSLVSIKDNSKQALGIVTAIQSGSMDPSRTPFAYQKTEEELAVEQPQIFAFLKTTFTVQACGYTSPETSSNIIFAIPPTPAKIHAFVSPANSDTSKAFFADARFLQVLYGYSPAIQNLDELLLAILRNIKQDNLLTEQLLENISHGFALLLGNDYRRLKVFLSRLEQL
jgi:hypothetical protein